MIRTFEFDDYPHDAERLISTIDWLKRRHPKFKCNVFAIPAAMTDCDWRPLLKRSRWVRVFPHGFLHQKGECRRNKMWPRRLGLLEYVSRDERWGKLFKAPWTGYSNEFLTQLVSMGYKVAMKVVPSSVPLPTRSDVVAWNIEDARIATGGFDSRQAVHVESHPVYRSERSIKSYRTQISRRNVLRWRRRWGRRDRWAFVDDFAKPLLIKLNLGCGPHVWPGWTCCDPRSKLHPDIIEWDFSRPIPCGANRADIATTSHVFNYLSDDEYVGACLDVWRVLRPGGVFRLQEDLTESGHVWRYPGAENTRNTGEVKSLPTRAKIIAALERVGFEVHESGPGRTLSPHKDVLQGDNRARHYRLGHKFYIEAVKAIEIPDVKRAMRHDPRARRNGAYALAE